MTNWTLPRAADMIVSARKRTAKNLEKQLCACGCGQPAGEARNGRPSRYASYECQDIAAKRRSNARKKVKRAAQSAISKGTQ